MPPYKPSEHPQEAAWNYIGKAMSIHEAEHRKYGPPPPNYTVRRNRGRHNVWEIIYTETSSSSSSKDHPLSPKANASGQSPIIHDEPTLDKEECCGLFNVPINYKAGQVIWRKAINWQTALAVALAKVGIQTTAQNVQAIYDGLPAATKSARQNSVLYHPTNRDSIVFKDEAAVAMVARAYNLSTVLFCPWVDHEGKGYKYIYNTENRPPIYARWSTGEQSLFPPLLFGCIPKQTTLQNKDFDVMWFNIEPNQQNVPTWYREIFVAPDIVSLAMNLGFPTQTFEPKVFLWSLVSLHRRMVVGYVIPDEHLACWIWQFGEHLANECSTWSPPQLSPFNYDHTKLNDYKRQFPNAYLNFDRLSRFMVNPHMKDQKVYIARYAGVWDDAINAQIKYQINNKNSDWSNFEKALVGLQRLPF